MDIKTLASELAASLEWRTQNNGNKFVCLKNGAPEWMTDVIRGVHDQGNVFPDDTIYEFNDRAVDTVISEWEYESERMSLLSDLSQDPEVTQEDHDAYRQEWESRNQHRGGMTIIIRALFHEFFPEEKSF